MPLIPTAHRTDNRILTHALWGSSTRTNPSQMRESLRPALWFSFQPSLRTFRSLNGWETSSVSIAPQSLNLEVPSTSQPTLTTTRLGRCFPLARNFPLLMIKLLLALCRIRKSKRSNPWESSPPCNSSGRTIHQWSHSSSNFWRFCATGPDKSSPRAQSWTLAAWFLWKNLKSFILSNAKVTRSIWSLKLSRLSEGRTTRPARLGSLTRAMRSGSLRYSIASSSGSAKGSMSRLSLPLYMTKKRRARLSLCAIPPTFSLFQVILKLHKKWISTSTERWLRPIGSFSVMQSQEVLLTQWSLHT